jgi:hypothetical protein
MPNRTFKYWILTQLKLSLLEGQYYCKIVKYDVIAFCQVLHYLLSIIIFPSHFCSYKLVNMTVFLIIATYFWNTWVCAGLLSAGTSFWCFYWQYFQPSLFLPWWCKHPTVVVQTPSFEAQIEWVFFTRMTLRVNFAWTLPFAIYCRLQYWLISFREKDIGCVISGFCHGLNGVFTLLGCYTA